MYVCVCVYEKINKYKFQYVVLQKTNMYMYRLTNGVSLFNRIVRGVYK